ncbi:MAG: hypothetical protein GX632_04745, partial [Propioniciclava sp.]|nr:hypothetical protein [Propioniciclava sp.]
ESVAGRQWRMDLRRTLRVPEAVRGVADLVGRLVRPARPAPANRSGRPGS